MISELKVIDPSKCAVHWWKDAPALAQHKSIEFKPGLNILWGRNGVGKSTILKTISRLFCCGQSGRPYVSNTAIDDLYHDARLNFKNSHPDGVLPVHDGQAVVMFDPDARVGLRFGGAAFDDDFMKEAIVSMAKVSSGQQTGRALAQQLAPEYMKDGGWPSIEWKILRQSYLSDLSKDRVEFLQGVLSPSIELGQPTILMDEPEKSLDLDTAETMWNMIRRRAKTHQIIVATHSVFALGIEDANYIEIKDPDDEGSYLQWCQKMVRSKGLDKP